MPLSLTEEYKEVLTAPEYLPCISLIMPFEPKMCLETELSYKLDNAADRIERKLKGLYTEERVECVMKSLRFLLKSLDYNTHKKSIAIFISPVFEKVYYLDIPLEEKIVIDDSFEIRDLIYSKKEIHKYLLVVLSNKATKIFLGNTIHFFPVVLNVPNHISAYINEIPEKVANFSDANARKELLLDKFLRHTDNGLSHVLQAYKLPLFVMGTEKTVGHFKSISHNTKHVIEYIHGNFEDKSEVELKAIMDPYVTDWKKLLQHNLMKQIDDAMGAGKVAIGIRDVWKDATQKKGRLLIVEKNYMFPAKLVSGDGKFSGYDPATNNAFYIKDAIDDIIEKVLASGGDVEFVDEGFLSDFKRIVLIDYYKRP
ncbi:baeRF3 domain-containing protein [Flavihumibacter profundi]|uniref:baeRF3 domain-containing protein n=1 Tax=Flavihumibacter profundi TaxID=2716883 RepID=UPI001CC7D61A|nr:hypothetical protein [Flavihumibacter profundi]MBZ5856551.1 hypothetical protein [Flavihumibacter profundi]